jgi:hypothetical protein
MLQTKVRERYKQENSLNQHDSGDMMSGSFDALSLLTSLALAQDGQS